MLNTDNKKWAFNTRIKMETKPFRNNKKLIIYSQ